jgi:hypothetical protein
MVGGEQLWIVWIRNSMAFSLIVFLMSGLLVILLESPSISCASPPTLLVHVNRHLWWNWALVGHWSETTGVLTLLLPLLRTLSTTTISFPTILCTRSFHFHFIAWIQIWQCFCQVCKITFSDSGWSGNHKTRAVTEVSSQMEENCLICVIWRH